MLEITGKLGEIYKGKISRAKSTTGNAWRNNLHGTKYFFLETYNRKFLRSYMMGWAIFSMKLTTRNVENTDGPNVSMMKLTTGNAWRENVQGTKYFLGDMYYRKFLRSYMMGWTIFSMKLTTRNVENTDGPNVSMMKSTTGNAWRESYKVVYALCT